MDRARFIFENEISPAAYRRAVRTKAKHLRKYGDGGDAPYHLRAVPAPAIAETLGVRQLLHSDTPACPFDEKSVIIGNIRMGFGHYRISTALASAAHALGYQPYWFDLHSFSDAPCGKIIREQNRLYSLGSRLSQSSRLFNKLVWEPLNSEGFRRLSYNAADQKTAELMTNVFSDLPRDIPFIAAHVWPAQAAVHAGLTHVVNAIPDNWPMALHLSEGAIHAVQTPSAYLGYRALRGMNGKQQLKPMPKEAIVYTGHYVDHELLRDLEADCDARTARVTSGAPKRWLMSVGGAGAQQALFRSVIERLAPDVRQEKAALFLNVGDHGDVRDAMLRALRGMGLSPVLHYDDFAETTAFCNAAYSGSVTGVHLFYHSDIFAAVYSTNLLMRVSDVLITKPSELSFYPVPKLMIPRVGGHEAWGAIRSAEVGDGTYECSSPAEVGAVLRMMQQNDDIIPQMCEHIKTAHRAGIYDGAYRAVQLAVTGSPAFSHKDLR